MKGTLALRSLGEGGACPPKPWRRKGLPSVALAKEGPALRSLGEGRATLL